MAVRRWCQKTKTDLARHGARKAYAERLCGEFHVFVLVFAALGHVDKWRSQRRIDVMSMKPRKLSAVLS